MTHNLRGPHLEGAAERGLSPFIQGERAQSIHTERVEGSVHSYGGGRAQSIHTGRVQQREGSVRSYREGAAENSVHHGKEDLAEWLCPMGQQVEERGLRKRPRQTTSTNKLPVIYFFLPGLAYRFSLPPTAHCPLSSSNPFLRSESCDVMASSHVSLDMLRCAAILLGVS